MSFTEKLRTRADVSQAGDCYFPQDTDSSAYVMPMFQHQTVKLNNKQGLTVHCKNFKTYNILHSLTISVQCSNPLHVHLIWL